MNKKIKAVIFDLDGTITEPFFDFERIKKEIGLPEGCGPLLEAMEKVTADQRKFAEDILSRHEQLAVDKSTLNPGTKETLQTLSQMGFKMGILTRNRRDNALAVLEKHTLKFDIVIGRDDGPVKPDAFGVLHTCEKFGVCPSQTLVVGDYLFDLQCARTAGAVAVLLANHKDARQFACYADYTIEKIEQILDIIAKRNIEL
ncbi:MAG: HAD family hydrolase [Phycisphaerae bacterium]|nr:HAD family hydrolase [Phycisphaerae bacterium]